MHKLSASMNSYLADLVVFYLKLHDLHWNVRGPQFLELHRYTEARYGDTAEKLDAVAELMRMHGEKPLSSLSGCLKLASLREPARDSYPDSQALQLLTEDLALLNTQAQALRGEAEQAGLFDVTALLEAHIGDYNKQLWFLRSMQA